MQNGTLYLILRYLQETDCSKNLCFQSSIKLSIHFQIAINDASVFKMSNSKRHEHKLIKREKQNMFHVHHKLTLDMCSKKLNCNLLEGMLLEIS